jgi:hypothetical protein
MTFKEALQSLQKEVIALQDNTEVIGEDDVVKAYVVLNYIDYQNIADAFLGCASLNLLNTYARQPDAKIGYLFRAHFYNFFKGIEDLDLKTKLKIYYDEDDRLMVFSFWDFQFSFHNIRYNDVVRKLDCGKVEWDGIRKQRCAETIFDFALSNNYISNKTLSGNSLTMLVDDEIDLYEEGGYRFIIGKLIRIKDNYRPIEVEDRYDKNYLRTKLLECQDRPVILIGKFVKVWKNHVTFITIRPYIPGVRTTTICNHVNLYRPDVETVMDINQLEKGRKYYIIGRCTQYPHSFRMGIKLDLSIKPSPLVRLSDMLNMPTDLFSVCHRFDLDEFKSNKNKHLRL